MHQLHEPLPVSGLRFFAPGEDECAGSLSAISDRAMLPHHGFKLPATSPVETQNLGSARPTPSFHLPHYEWVSWPP
jgi:hypothetical protein